MITRKIKRYRVENFFRRLVGKPTRAAYIPGGWFPLGEGSAWSPGINVLDPWADLGWFDRWCIRRRYAKAIREGDIYGCFVIDDGHAREEGTP